MMRRRVTLALLLLASAAVSAAEAQQPARATVDNRHAWLVYVGDHPLSSGSRTSLHLESQVRRGDLGADWQQLLLRAGLTRTLSPGVRVTGGYGFVRTHPYGEAPVRAAFPEHRAWQQLTLGHGAGPLSLTHRYRLEQRWIGTMELADPSRVAGWRYANRFRYLARAALPVSGQPNGPGHTYLAGSGELFTSFGRDVQGNVFDQSRLGAAVGRHVSSTVRVEAGYLHQYLLKSTGRDAERNHTLHLAVLASTALPF